MMLQDFIASFTRKAQQSGISYLEFYIKECSGQTIQVYKQEVERLSLSDETLVFVEGEYKGHKGSTFVENIGTARLDDHLDVLRQIAQYNKEPFQPRPCSNIGPQPQAMPETLPSTEEVTHWLKQAEQRAYDYDKRIDNVRSVSHSTRIENIVLLDDQGRRLEDTLHYDQVEMTLVARDSNEVQSAFETRLAKSIDQNDLLSTSDQGAEKVISQLQASPVKTGQYQVILQNNLVCDLVLAFLPGFYADRVRKKMSVLAEDVGRKIASPFFSLIEDPQLASGIVTRSFDDEGTPTTKKAIIHKGQLNTFFHNLDTARKAKRQSTGNGFKNIYREPPAVRPTNIHILGGTKTFNEMVSDLNDGLIITDCDGIFAGANPVSGDFSLIAKGYLVEAGTVQRAVNQITIGGNYYEMLKRLFTIGGDYTTGGSAGGFIQAPSLLVDQLFVSGT